MKTNAKSLLTTLPLVLLGNAVYAMGIALFIQPSGLISGGTTGISLLLSRLTGAPLSVFVLGLNTVMFFIGLWLLGKGFALTTLVSSFCYPVILRVIERLRGDMLITDDLLLCALFGGILIGAGLGLVIRCGSSTGGMDIPPLVLNKFYGIPVSATLWVLDCVILALQAAFTSKEAVLYGILLVIVYTTALDKLLILGKSRIQLKVVSRHSEEIRQAILSRIDRGVTLLNGTTGYLDKPAHIVLTVISARELPRTEDLIYDIDPEAFVIVNKISEVRGRGFSVAKHYPN